MPPSDLIIEASPEKLRRLRELRAERARRQREVMRSRFPTPGALARHVDHRTRQTAPLDLIDAAVVSVVLGDVHKQQIYAPPQIGKSQRVSRWTPLWALLCDPTLRIAVVSAEKELAVRWGRQIKRDVEDNPDLGLRLRSDSQAAGRWETEQGGGLYCVGITGTLTGQPVDLLIIDDPIKDRAAAESKTQRDRAWDFWENVGGVRARRTILMNTRWHTDDLAGRLAQREAGQWQILSMPALATSDDDPLGREIGEEIESANVELHPPGYYRAKQQTTSAYVWSSLYQQSPTLGEGNIFKRGDWRFWRSGDDGDTLNLDGSRYARSGCERFITMDLATSTKTSADFTVASAWAITPGGDLVLLDRRRDRVPEESHAEFVAPLRQRWLTPYDVTHIESRMFGTTLVYDMGRDGVPIAELDADTDKVTRAMAAAKLVRQHRVWLPADAPWLDEWLDEHADFDKGKHDDQVDTTGYAARVAMTHFLPPETAEQTQARAAAERRSSSDEVDFMTAAF